MEKTNSIRVILIEDNLKEAKEIKTLFEHASEMCFEVIERKHPREIIATLDELPCHVILVTQALLEGFGREGINQIRDRYPLIPLIALVRLEDNPTLLQPDQFGADDYLLKGFIETKSLVRLIHTEIQHRRLVSSLSDLLHQQNVLYDELTGVPNRILFMDRLNQAIASSKRDKASFALFLVDINNSQALNDEWGRKTVDALFAEAADRLQKCVHSPDTCARYSGDKFAILLTNIRSVSMAAKVAQITQRVLSEPYTLHGAPFFLTASIGISVYPNDGHDAKKLLQHVEEALCEAKTHGQEQIQFHHPKTQRQIEQQLKQEKEMRVAWAQGQFVIFYDLLVETKEQKTVAMQAQVRWHHPERGLVPQNEFIRLADETGLLFPLGDWLVRTICKQQLVWQQQGLPVIPVSIALSEQQLLREDLPDALSKILAEQAIEPHALILEFSEFDIMKHQTRSERQLHALKDIGVLLTLNHFVGDCSISVGVKNLPIDNVKLIDQSRLDWSQVNLDFIQANLALVKSLHKSVIVSGVDSEAQFLFLQQHECDLVQGTLFSQSVSLEQAQALLQSQSLGDFFKASLYSEKEVVSPLLHSYTSSERGADGNSQYTQL